MNDLIIRYEEIEYRKAFTEILEILKYIPKSDYKKIPNKIIQTIKNNSENTYNFKIDTNKSLKEQNISNITKAIIENFYRDYWVTDIERKKIIQEQNKKRAKIEEEKRKKYNPDDLFKNKDQRTTIKIEENKEKYPIEIKKQNYFTKFIIFIKKIFNHKH